MHPNHMKAIFVLLAIMLLIALAYRSGIENSHNATVTVSTSTFTGRRAGVESGSIKNDGNVTLGNTIVVNSPSGGSCDACSPISADGENVDFDDTACPNFRDDR